jgi:3'-5' exoribonuclease
MKSHYVSDLQDGQAVTSLFLVAAKEIRTSQRSGKSWLELALRDRTGSIPAKMWDNFEALAKTFEANEVIQIRGRVKLYNGQKEMTLEQIVSVAARDYDLADFLAHTKFEVEKLYAELGAAVGAVRNPWIKRLLESVVIDPAIVPKLKRAPAAMSMHHAFVGGLLEHTVSLISLGRAIVTNYTTAGRLLGHITIGTLLVREKIKAIPGFPEPLAILIEHLIVSHHGTYEFGSPSLPQTREAIALHFLDDMDSKMAAMRATLEGASGGEEWTERNPALHRALLRTDKFLGGGDSGHPAEAAAGDSSPQRTVPGGPRNSGGAR